MSCLLVLSYLSNKSPKNLGIFLFSSTIFKDHLRVPESSSDADERDVAQLCFVVQLPVEIDVFVELVQVPVGHDDRTVRRRQCDDSVHFAGLEIRVKVE